MVLVDAVTVPLRPLCTVERGVGRVHGHVDSNGVWFGVVPDRAVYLCREGRHWKTRVVPADKWPKGVGGTVCSGFRGGKEVSSVVAELR